MKSTALFAVCTLVLLAIAPHCVAGTYEEELGKLSSSLGSSIEKAGIKTVAVGGIRDVEGKETKLGKLLAEDLSVDLVNQSKGVSVVDRANLSRIMEEYKLTEEGLIDPANAKKLKLAGIDAIILGTITPFEGTYRIALKAIATDSARLVAATRGSVAETESLDALMGIARLQPRQGAQSPAATGAAQRPAEKKSVYDLGTASVEIKSASFLRKSGRVRVIYSVTNKTTDTHAFAYHLTDRNAPPNSPEYYNPAAYRRDGSKPDLKLEGEATDDRGQSYRPLLPSDATTTPTMPPNSPISFTIEYQVGTDAGSTVQIPASLSLSFEFFVGYPFAIRSSNALVKFSAVDYPIDKVQ